MRAAASNRSRSITGAPLSGSAVVLFNKPYGVLCRFSRDGSGKPTLADYVSIPDVYPAGRLDADSEGLVVLTADGALQARIANPRFRLAKTYRVHVDGVPTHAQLAALAEGVDVGEFVTAPAHVHAIPEPSPLWPRTPPIRHRKALPTSWIELELTEGRNRQVRRMTAAVGLPTLRLIRFRVGPWAIDGLEPGAWRREVASLAVLSSRPVR
jgi:23S rRNA pseudouridine2457 synthase